MVFLFWSTSCIRLAWATAPGLLRLVLEERAIQAVPLPSLVLQDVLGFWLWYRSTTTVGGDAVGVGVGVEA